MIHGQLMPESVFVNAKGDWKIAGMNFCQTNVTPGASLPPLYDGSLPSVIQPNLDFLGKLSR